MSKLHDRLLAELRAALWQVRMSEHGCQEDNECYSECSEHVDEKVAADLAALGLTRG